jgi:hypothetical protein
MATESPTGSRFKYSIIRCSSYKTGVGVVDFYNIGQLIHDLAKKLGWNLN